MACTGKRKQRRKRGGRDTTVVYLHPPSPQWINALVSNLIAIAAVRLCSGATYYMTNYMKY
jgi:hypothetical protein